MGSCCYCFLILQSLWAKLFLFLWIWYNDLLDNLTVIVGPKFQSIFFCLEHLFLIEFLSNIELWTVFSGELFSLFILVADMFNWKGGESFDGFSMIELSGGKFSWKFESFATFRRHLRTFKVMLLGYQTAPFLLSLTNTFINYFLSVLVKRLDGIGMREFV